MWAKLVSSISKTCHLTDLSIVKIVQYGMEKVYDTEKVRWLSGYSALAGEVKVQLRYSGNTR